MPSLIDQPQVVEPDDRRALPALAYAVALFLVAFLGAERGRAAGADVAAALGPGIVEAAASPDG